MSEEIRKEKARIRRGRKTTGLVEIKPEGKMYIASSVSERVGGKSKVCYAPIEVRRVINIHGSGSFNYIGIIGNDGTKKARLQLPSGATIDVPLKFLYAFDKV